MPGRVADSINICLLALTGLIFASLASYSSQDPGWTLAAGDEASNLLGVFGAWLASSLYLLFGLAAWLLPLGLLLLVSGRLFGWPGSAEEEGRVRLHGLLHLGICLLLLAVSGLSDMHFYEWQANLPGGSGGRLGRGLTELLSPWFGFLGATLLLLTVLLVGLTLSLSVNWGRTADELGSLILFGLVWLQGALRGSLQKLRRLWQMRSRLSWPKKPKPARKEPSVRAPKTAEPAKETRPAAPPAGEKETPTESDVLPQREAPREAVQNVMPSINLLASPENSGSGYSEADLEKLSRLLESKLHDYGIEAEVTSVLPGPVITRFEILPAAGVKVSRISALVKDLARSLAVVSVRIVEVIPGKPVVGVEIPNADRQTVRLSEILGSPVWDKSASTLSLALGHDIAGESVVVDLAKMPHLLVAGTTGSGKSVGINAMILSLLYKARPDEVRLIMVDPKMLELSVYEGIPHLLTPVVTDMKDAANALRWCVVEMDRRYRLMAALGVRNLSGFNRKLREAGGSLPDPLAELSEEEEGSSAPQLEPLPYIVVIIDEFADMMMIVGKKVEELISRIAQKARAAGIHLILATQRPSVDVITGLIKANVPTRISFQVSSKIDSRTILDQSGAEQLLGHGDLLYLPAGSPLPIRVHGAFVSDEEVHEVVAAVKAGGEARYQEGILNDHAETRSGAPAAGQAGENAEVDDCYDEAAAFVMETRKASISSVQRKFRIGYNRAARLIEAMEEAGIVSPMNSNGLREVLVPAPGQEA